MSDLTDFIESTERKYFRTASDTGANSNALLIWNCVREHAGLKRLTKDELFKRERDYYMACLAQAAFNDDTENMDLYKGAIRRLDERA